jgi:hypothetical protein
MYTDFLINIGPTEFVISNPTDDTMKVEETISTENEYVDINIQSNIETQLITMENELAIRKSMEVDGNYTWKQSYHTIINPFRDYLLNNSKNNESIIGLSDTLIASIETTCKYLDIISNMVTVSYELASSEISEVYPRIYPNNKQDTLDGLFKIYSNVNGEYIKSNITLLSVTQLIKNTKRNILSIANIISVAVNTNNISVDLQDTKNAFNITRSNIYKELVTNVLAKKEEMIEDDNQTTSDKIYTLLKSNPNLLKTDVITKSLMLYTNIKTLQQGIRIFMDGISTNYRNNMLYEFEVRGMISGNKAKVNKLNESCNYHITYLQELIQNIIVESRLSNDNDFLSKVSSIANNIVIDKPIKKEEVVNEDVSSNSISSSVTIIIPILHGKIIQFQQ